MKHNPSLYSLRSRTRRLDTRSREISKRVTQPLLNLTGVTDDKTPVKFKNTTIMSTPNLEASRPRDILRETFPRLVNRGTVLWFNIEKASDQYRKSHCGDKNILRPSYLHNGISYTGKMTSLYWIMGLVCVDQYYRYALNSLSFCVDHWFGIYTPSSTLHPRLHSTSK